MLIGFADSVDDHGIERSATLEVLRDPFRHPVEEREQGDNFVIFWVGRTLSGQLLEVGVEYGIDDEGSGEWAWIFHSDDARAHWKDKYKG